MYEILGLMFLEELFDFVFIYEIVEDWGIRYIKFGIV